MTRELIALIALTAAAAVAQDAPPTEIPPPFMAAPRTTHAPVIDGTIGDGEWRQAAATTGFINIADANLAQLQTVVRVCYDAERLYLGFELPIGPEELPRASATERDTGVWADDSIEVYLLPEGGGDDDILQLVGNSAGTIFDRRGADTSWDADWQFVNRVERGHWSAELSAAWSDLGVNDPSGQTWRVQFARSAGVFTAWAYTVRGYNNPPLWGRLKFAGDSGIAQFSKIDTARPGGLLVDGLMGTTTPDVIRVSAAADLQAFGPAQDKSLPAPNNRDWRAKSNPQLSGGGEHAFSFTLPAGDEGRKLLYLGAADDRGNLLHHQVVPVVITPPTYVELLAHPGERHAYLHVDLRTLPRGEVFDLHLMAVQQNGSFSAIMEWTAFASERERYIALDVRQWPLGSYNCEFRLLKAGSEQVAREGSFVYERIEPPVWYTEGTKLGRSDTVPAPWTPMQWRDDGFEVSGRSHTLGHEALPAQVRAAGEDLLASPVRLEAGIGDDVVTITNVRRRPLAQSEVQGGWETVGSLGTVPIKLKTTAEFDGMMRFDLELLPAAPELVNSLRLVIPIRPERAIYYHHCSSYYARGYAGLLPEAGLTLGFRPFVWLGDDERGLMWFAESTRGWTQNEQPITVRRGPDATELVVTLIGAPVTLDKTAITFGLQATPTKPVPPDWRAWRIDRAYPKRQVAKHEVNWEQQGIDVNWRLLWFCDGRVPLYCNLHTAPLDVTDDLGTWATKMHEQDSRVVPYLYLHGVSVGATGYDRYYPHWQITSPRQIGGGDRVIMGACPSSAFGDYLIYGIAQWAEKYDADGVYFDGAGPPVTCANSLHQHGFSTADGVRHVEYPIFGLREFYKRLWIALSERVDEPIIWTHADGKMPAPCFSFTTSNWIGEMVQGPLRTGDAFLSDMLPPDFWRAYMQATQWGPVPTWLVTTSRTNEAMQIRQQMDTWAVLLVNGVPFARRGHLSTEQIKRVWTAQSDFGIGDANFHGYWRNANAVSLAPADEHIMASFYERDGKVLLIIANFTDEDSRVSATLKGAALPAAGSFTDVMSDATVTVTGGVVTVTVAAKSFRLLRG